MIDLHQQSGAIVLPVRAQAGAKRDEIRGEHNGMLKVCVAQAPEKGKANKAIVALLARELNLKRSQFKLVSGQTSSEKRFLVESIELSAPQLQGPHFHQGEQHKVSGQE